MNHLHSDPTPADLKIRLSNLTSEEEKALGDLYHDRWRRHWLRTNGWVNIFLGGLTMWFVLSDLPYMPLPRIIQTVIGALMVGQSLLAIVLPSTAGFFRFAAVFLISGIWNIFLGVFAWAFLAGLLGVFQLWWAYEAFREYRRFRALMLPEPQPDINRLYDEVFQAITKKTFKNDPNLIAMWIGYPKWQGLLLENKAVLAFRKQKLLVVRSKENVNFMPTGSNLIRKRRIYGRIKLHTNTERAMMKRDSFETYVHWKGLESVLTNTTPTLWQRLPKPIRIAFVIIGVLILLFIAFMIINVIALTIKYS